MNSTAGEHGTFVLVAVPGGLGNGRADCKAN